MIGNDLNLSDSNYFGAVNVILSTYEQLGQGHATRISCSKPLEQSALINRTMDDYYRASSLTWPVSMLINWNKRNHLREKRVKLPEDFLGTPTWPPFHCFGTPIWPL